MGANQKESTRAATNSSPSARIVEKIVKKQTERPAYKTPKIREIDPAGVLYAAFN